MKTQNAEVKFVDQTGMCDSPGVYIRVEKMAMAKPIMQAFGITVSIDTAMDIISGIAEALEEYERWEDEQTTE